VKLPIGHIKIEEMYLLLQGLPKWTLRSVWLSILVPQYIWNAKFGQ